MENQKQVQNVKEKINSMKKKFQVHCRRLPWAIWIVKFFVFSRIILSWILPFLQSLAMVCDYVEGMEKYEQALETDPESKMVKELSHKLEKLKSAPKVSRLWAAHRRVHWKLLDSEW